MPTFNASAAVNLDTLINNTYEVIYDEAAKDLQDVADQIDQNTQEKQALRDLQVEFDLVKNACKNAQTQEQIDAAWGDLVEFVNKVQADYPNSALADAAGWDQFTGWQWNTDAGKEKMDEIFGPIDNALKNEMDARADISSKLQVEINQKSSIARRAEKAISDNVANVERNANSIAGNLKG